MSHDERQRFCVSVYLWVSVSVCFCVCVLCLSVSVLVYLSVCVSLCLYVSVCMSLLCLCVSTYPCTCVSLCVCMSMCLCDRVSVCMFLCLCVYMTFSGESAVAPHLRPHQLPSHYELSAETDMARLPRVSLEVQVEVTATPAVLTHLNHSCICKVPHPLDLEREVPSPWILS